MTAEVIQLLFYCSLERLIYGFATMCSVFLSFFVAAHLNQWFQPSITILKCDEKMAAVCSVLWKLLSPFFKTIKNKCVVRRFLQSANCVCAPKNDKKPVWFFGVAKAVKVNLLDVDAVITLLMARLVIGLILIPPETGVNQTHVREMQGEAQGFIFNCTKNCANVFPCALHYLPIHVLPWTVFFFFLKQLIRLHGAILLEGKHKGSSL